MTPELEAHLKSLVNLPSPPGVAAQIIELAQDPDIEMGRVARAVGLDPALTTKILRIANSAIYAQRRRSENLRQALVVLGLNATLTLALSFTLVRSLKAGSVNGLDYAHYWRRTLLAGTAARALGEAAGQTLGEELFLAGLLQDIGMIALDRSRPDMYAGTAELQHAHPQLLPHERKLIGVDHAEVGAWLMRQWNLPERLWRAVEGSHKVDTRRALTAEDGFGRCVALSGPLADAYLAAPEARAKGLNETAQQAERIFGLRREAFAAVVERIAAMLPEVEAVFDTSILPDSDAIMEHARELLMVRNLHTLREVNNLRVTADSLSARAMELEAETRRDALTGVFNRSFLEQFLAREFDSAAGQGWPLSVAFCDLDHFKKVNDTFGHQAGDRVLQTTARVLRGNTRDSDVVGRFGGEEFVLVLPNCDGNTCQSVCERIVAALAGTRQDIGQGELAVTISIGFATQSPDTPFESGEALLAAADAALYAAKMQGRNRAVGYGEDSPAPIARFR